MVLPEDVPEHPQAGLHMLELVHDVTGPQRQVRPLVDMSATPTAAPPRAARPKPSD